MPSLTQDRTLERHGYGHWYVRRKRKSELAIIIFVYIIGFLVLIAGMIYSSSASHEEPTTIAAPVE